MQCKGGFRALGMDGFSEIRECSGSSLFGALQENRNFSHLLLCDGVSRRSSRKRHIGQLKLGTRNTKLGGTATVLNGDCQCSI